MDCKYGRHYLTLFCQDDLYSPGHLSRPARELFHRGFSMTKDRHHLPQFTLGSTIFSGGRHHGRIVNWLQYTTPEQVGGKKGLHTQHVFLSQLSAIRLGLFQMNNNFCVKTFEGLLTTRSLTGITRIADHFLLNRIQMVADHSAFLIHDITKSDIENLAVYLEKLGALIETHYDRSDVPNSFRGELMGYIPNPINPDRLSAMVHIARSSVNECFLNVYSDLTNRTLPANIKEILSSCIKPQPIQMTMVSGFNDQGQSISTTREIERDYDVPADCFYPSIEESIDELSNGFLTSNNNLLFMISPAGCGKTSLVRELCRRWKHKSIVQISGQKTITHPAFDAYIATLSDNTLCVIEDADILVESRKLGNTSMDAFLNELNGISNRGIKFIITTNLESRKSVDTALLRPGRCYAVLEFKPLTRTDCLAIRDHFQTNGPEHLAHRVIEHMPAEGARVTLAELLSKGGGETTKTGF